MSQLQACPLFSDGSGARAATLRTAWARALRGGTALAGGLLAAAIANPQSALAAACDGQNTATVTCPTIETTNNTERNTTFNGDQTVTVTGDVTGQGIQVNDGGANNAITV